MAVAKIEEEAPAAFLERVRRAQEYIRAGDIYQANLSRPGGSSSQSEPDVAGLYDALCAANPAPFAALAQWQGISILSSSPERLVSLTRWTGADAADCGNAAAQSAPGRRCLPR